MHTRGALRATSANASRGRHPPAPRVSRRKLHAAPAAASLRLLRIRRAEARRRDARCLLARRIAPRRFTLPRFMATSRSCGCCWSAARTRRPKPGCAPTAATARAAAFPPPTVAALCSRRRRKRAAPAATRDDAAPRSVSASHRPLGRVRSRASPRCARFRSMDERRCRWPPSTATRRWCSCCWSAAQTKTLNPRCVPRPPRAAALARICRRSNLRPSALPHSSVLCCAHRMARRRLSG